MQKREKILLAILLVILSALGFQRLIGFESKSESTQLQAYKIENLQKMIKDTEVNQISNISMDFNIVTKDIKKSLKNILELITKYKEMQKIFILNLRIKKF